jgi:cellobiose epimerase
MHRLWSHRAWLIPALLLTTVASAWGAADKATAAAEYLPRLEKILTENIAPFWYDKSLDREHGGYIIDFDAQGRRKSRCTKMIVTQARTVWLFSRLARAGYRRDEYLEAADVGYRFLKDKMWDQDHGGFYWEVDVTGDRQLKPNKHLYGQSFALYALSEYYLASGKQEVLDFAVRLFNLLEAKAYDKTYGGYIESFEPDWTETATGEDTYMGTSPDLKLMNTHLHLMEAITTFYRASKLPLARERLLELVNIQSNTVMRKSLGACTDKYDRNWKPRLDADYAQVSYGHDIENIWLLMDTCSTIGLSNYPFGDLYETLFDYSLAYGHDGTEGGFYYTGPFNKPATDRSKSWWVQAEALVSALHMYRFTGNPKYLTIFEKTFEFIEEHLVDSENGEWHHIITPDGTTRGDKASPWKAGYHNGRAVIECIEILKAWQTR